MNLENNIIWSATDGSQGMISQANGLASELSSEIVEIKTDLIFPWNKLQPGILPPFKWIFKNNIPNDHLPKIFISCGRKSVYLSLYLKKKYRKIINIHIQNPKTSFKNFNFIVAPNHDQIKGSNIINSIGALHHFNLNNIQSDKDFLNIKSNNLVTCLIGGENQHYKFGEQETTNLCDKLLTMIKQNPSLNLLVITSRRTSNSIKKILDYNLKDFAKIWSGGSVNPYSFAIKNSSYFILTSDSTSMISESAISGKPIYIFQLPFKRISKRLENFHNEFKNLNITREFNDIKKLEIWDYKPLNETKRIAGIIKQRIIEEYL